MKKTLISACCCALILVNYSNGYAGWLNSGPKNKAEAFPCENQDPRLGIIINYGTAESNIFIYNEVGRLIEPPTYLPGANPWVTANNQTIPRCWMRRLKIGRYRVEIHPFYYQTNVTARLFGQPGRYRVDLPIQIFWLYVGHNPTAAYCYEAGRYYGWILRFNSGRIFRTADGLPGIRLNVWGDFRRGR